MRVSVYFLATLLPLGSGFLSLPQQQTHRLVTLDVVATHPGSEGESSRRNVLQTGALALSSLLVPGLLPIPADAIELKTIVLTGGNSGESLEMSTKIWGGF